MDDTLLPSNAPDPRIGATLQDRYRIVRKLGEGGMGAVYEGEHVLIKRRVAIKCLHAHYAQSPEVVARFHREALAATSIHHPNIIECTDMGRLPDGAFFMVLEFLEGQDWAHALAASGPSSLSRVVHIVSQVCDALIAAHAKGIVHRDLKPENIFLIARGGDPDFVKVLDFGISKMRGSEGEGPSKSLTRTGTAMGTPYYMAPEQAQGKRDIDHRADVYALGVILFQALTGQYPFDDESYPMLVLKVCTQEAPPIDRFRPDLPPDVVHLVRRMLAKSPADRPADCAAVKATLAPFRAHTAAPVIAKDAPSTASLPIGTFDGVVASSATAPAPAAGERAAIAAPAAPAAAASTGPLGVGARVSSATPFASPDDADLPRLSHAAPARRSSGVSLAIGGALLAAGGIVAAVIATQSGRSTDPAVTAAAPVVAPVAAPIALPDATPVTLPAAAHVLPVPMIPTAFPAPDVPTAPVATVRVQIETVPADAEIFLDDHRMPNPFDGDLPQTSEPRNLRVEHDGYVTAVQDLVLEFSQRIRIPLQRGEGVEDRSSAPRRSSPSPTRRAATSTAATSVAVVAEPAPRAPEPAPPAAAPSRAPEPAPSQEATEGARRSLKNPFGR
jgi:serine/threonine protein kinase